MNRDRFEIARDILTVSDSEDGAKKTWIILRSNLCYKQTKVYLPLLEGKDFLNIKNNGEDVRYITSGKGRKFLKYMKNIDDLFNNSE